MSQNKPGTQYTVYVSRHTRDDIKILRKHEVNISSLFREAVRKKTDKLMKENKIVESLEVTDGFVF